jgi:site-specific DNA-methyltransferase (adenine-specific)
MKSKNGELLTQVKEATQSLTKWADVSNALFDPNVGLLTRAYPDRYDREEFMKTEEYKAIRQILRESIEKSGLVSGAEPEKSGRFVVRLPKTLHQALERESRDEGVSLNQLVVTKLAVKLSQIHEGPRAHNAKIAQAYLEVRDGYSTDRVIADPELNSNFLHRCRELGVPGTDYDLNWQLMGARKTGVLKDMPKTKKYTPKQIDDFEYASEIALASVSQLWASKYPEGLSLDHILCDPQLAVQFDDLAFKLAPGFSSLDYRWAALGVRKAAGRHKAKAAIADLVIFERLGIATSVKASVIPTHAGIYMFRTDERALYIGETENLRNRIERHFDRSNSIGIPEWIYDSGSRKIELGIVEAGGNSTARKISELRAIAEFTPVLNYLSAVA